MHKGHKVKNNSHYPPVSFQAHKKTGSKNLRFTGTIKIYLVMPLLFLRNEIRFAA
jgi:hypothetical protein